MVTAENLQTTELVTRIRNSGRRVRAVDVHLFELANHRGPEVSQRSSDARQHGIVLGKLLLAVVQIGQTFLQVDGKLAGVDDADVVAAVFRRFDQAFGAVTFGGTREDSEFHF